MTEIVNITDRERAKDRLIAQLSAGRDALAARLDNVRADLAQAQPAPLRDPLIVIRKRPGKTPCGECHLQAGEVCDICGAAQPAKDAA